MDTFELISQMTDFFSRVMGSETEVVIHDLETGKIAWISNGHITKREVNHKDDAIAMKILKEEALKSEIPNMLIGSKAITKEIRSLRSSNFFIPGNDGKVRYAVCVNQDISNIETMHKLLDQIIGPISEAKVAPIEGSISPIEDEYASVESLIKQFIYSEIERQKPFSMENRDAKLSIMQRLDEKGVFEVRGAVPIVCDYLQIAQATFYKYLKEIRK